MGSVSNRPPVLKKAHLPPTPVADLSEYTPSDGPEPTSLFSSFQDNPVTPTTDLVDAESPSPIPIAELDALKTPVHQAVALGIESPRNAQTESPCSKGNYPRWYGFILGFLLGLIFSIFSLLAVFLVNTKIRLFFVVGCMVGALVQAVIGLSAYEYVFLK